MRWAANVARMEEKCIQRFGGGKDGVRLEALGEVVVGNIKMDL